MELSIWNQPPEFLPMETRKSISNLIRNAWQMLGRKGETVASSYKKQATKQLHEARNFGGPRIQNVDHSIIVGVKKHMLTAPLMTLNVGGNYYWEQFHVGNRLLPLGGSPRTCEPMAL